MTAREDTPGSRSRVGVAVPAAGSGQRMGGTRKPFLELQGEPLLVHAIRPFLADARVVSIVVALPDEDAANPPVWLTRLDERVSVVAGGATRTESVRNALFGLPSDVDIIAVHDAARPLVTSATVGACIDVAVGGLGAVAGSKAVDTVKRTDASRIVVETPERDLIWNAHTPQVFPADLIRRAYAESDGGTDDAVLVERVGGCVRMVDDGGMNIKVTRPEDLAIAAAILESRGADG